MSYEVFQRKVNAFIAKAGGKISASYKHDAENGRFFANLSDGTTIIGRPSGLKLTVRWASGHQSMIAV